MKGKKIQKKGIKKRIILSGCIITTVGVMQFAMTGCSELKDERDNVETESVQVDHDYQIYCVNKEGTGLDMWGYDISSENISLDKVVSEIFTAFVGKPHVEGVNSAMPDSIKSVTCVVDKNIAKINMDKYYDKLDSLSQLYLRAALAMTLTQVDGIDYVYMTVNGQPLTDSAGKVVGYLNAKDFAIYDQEQLSTKNEIYMTLYYPNEAGDALVAEDGQHVLDGNINPAMYVLENLKSRVEKSGNATIPKNAVVDNVYIKGGICYVDFDDSINDDKYIGIEPEVMLYSIVNSLTDLGNVTGVQITINGGTDILFRDEIDLNQIFRLNLNYLQKKR